MDQFLERRSSETISLHNNFLAILNEKKRQIQHLNDLLIAFRQGRPTVNSAVEVKRRKKARTKRTNAPVQKTSPLPSSGSEHADSDESKYKTDDSASSPRERNTSPIPSTSAAADLTFADPGPQLFQLPRRVPDRDMIQAQLLPKTVFQEQTFSSKENEALSDTNEEAYVDFNTQDLLDNT